MLLGEHIKGMGCGACDGNGKGGDDAKADGLGVVEGSGIDLHYGIALWYGQRV